MAQKTDLPDEERVRILTADPNLTQDQANAYGDQFLDAGKHVQAMSFLERSRDPERLARVKKEAVGIGDAFLLKWIDRLVPNLIEPAEWAQAGRHAESRGHFLFARDCYERAGDAEKADAVHQEWLKIFEPPPSA